MSDAPSPPTRDWTVAGPLLLSAVVLGLVAAATPMNPASDLPGWIALPPDAVQSSRGPLAEALGLALFLVPIALIFLAIDWATPTPRRDRWRRVFAWLGLMLCATVAAEAALPPGEGLPIWGGGGVFGLTLATWFKARFTPMGTGMIFLAATSASTLIALERVLCPLAGLCGRVPWSKLKPRRPAWLKWPRRAVATPQVAVPITSVPIDARVLAPISAPAPVIAPARPAPVLPPRPVAIPITHSVPVPPTPPRANVPRPSYELPGLDLLDDPPAGPVQHDDELLRATATLLEKTFKEFGLTVAVVGIHTGPVVTQYEIALETGLRLSKVTALADDVALNLKVSSVRIIPLAGKSTMGVEVPNAIRAVVRLKELVAVSQERIAKAKLPLFLGKDSEGRPLIGDLAEMPHLLIAGRTGTGKSVCLNSIIVSMLLTRTPDQCRLIMIDPKQVELTDYATLPHLMLPVVKENKKAEAVLAWAVEKMEERYTLLSRAKVRNITGYNELPREEILRRVKLKSPEEADYIPERMAYIVIVVDEVGDLMMDMKKEVEGHIIRLAQKSRAAGIHLILTTQRPTVDVITGLIKSNLPARICFQVTNRTDSRVVLDEMGAERLLGKGDMLFLQPNTSTIIRGQGCYASDGEIVRIVGALERDESNFEDELLGLKTREEKEKERDQAEAASQAVQAAQMPSKDRDPMYLPAVEIILREQRGSVSLLQRALGIGYGRAARLVDFMCDDGLVGPMNGAQPREVRVTLEQWHAMRGDAAPSDEFAEESPADVGEAA